MTLNVLYILGNPVLGVGNAWRWMQQQAGRSHKWLRSCLSLNSSVAATLSLTFSASDSPLGPGLVLGLVAFHLSIGSQVRHLPRSSIRCY